jgi:Tol biopolymer transport system component
VLDRGEDFVSRVPKRAPIIATAIALTLALAGSALAVTVFQPTVSLTATSHNHLITAAGVYARASRKCQGPSGRPVLIHVSNGVNHQTHTRNFGRYTSTFGHFAQGHYTVSVIVPGEVRGGYGQFVACLDAHASAGVDVGHHRVQPSREIAFSKANGIYLASIDGTIIRRLTDVAGDNEPSWSPDGTQFAFVRHRHAKGSIYVADANGNGIHLVMKDASTPSWSPDGAWIAFVKDQRSGKGHCGLYLMHPDGSGVRLVTNRLCSSGISWSPDGTQIAFAGFPGYGSNGPLGPTKIDIISPDGTGLRRVSAGATDHVSPTWSPDGKQIAFESDGAGSSPGSIVIVNADGSNARRFTPGHPLVYSPTWSPDGQWLAYASGRTSKTLSIFLVHPDFSDVHRITRPGSGPLSDWRPSGL